MSDEVLMLSVKNGSPGHSTADLPLCGLLPQAGCGYPQC